MLELGTSNVLNSGPNGGKTTLYCQAVKSQLYGEREQFCIPELSFPEGRFCFVHTDRSMERYNNILVPMGLDSHPMIKYINFVDDLKWHNLTRPSGQPRPNQIENIQETLAEAINGEGISTMILDLNPFQHASTNSEAEWASRQTAIWAKELNVTLLCISYPFKQTTAKRAIRLQDRQSGFLHAQASQDWKFMILDGSENDTPYGVVGIIAPAGKGSGRSAMVFRGREAYGDPIGLYREYFGPRVQTIDEIMMERGVEYNQAWKIRKKQYSEAESWIENYFLDNP